MSEEDRPKAQTEVMSEQEALISSLPQSMRDQLRNGVIDVSNLTPEQLRGLTLGGATDGGIGDLTWATRGDTNSSPNDWKEVVKEETPVAVDHPRGEPVTPLNTPSLRPRGKSPDLPD